MTSDPFITFTALYEEAKKNSLQDPDIIALATAGKHARPSVRMVLYRGFREGGFSFFTNYESRKGRELTENPFAAIVFYWAHLGKQVRIEGSVERLSSAESDRYFSQRPLESRVSAAISKQSRPLVDEADFIARLGEAERSGTIARPDEWGGFKLIPVRYEFWTHGEHRRHTRVLYEKSGTEWQVSRLYP